MDLDGMARQARTAGVELVRFLYCDAGNMVRGKSSHIGALDDHARNGIGLVLAMAAFSMAETLAPVHGLGPVGEIRLLPDPETFAVLPYSPREARVLCDMRTLAGALWEAYPRTFLKRMISRCAEAGFAVEAAFEYEFYLARRTADGYASWDDSVCFGSAGMDAAAPVALDILAALDAQGIRPRQYYPELGPGQQEITVQHTPVLRTADTAIAVRETVRAIAAQHGAVVSFAPKPFLDQAGSGMHVHLSLWHAGRNLLYDPVGVLGLSRLGRAFVAGILAHMPALLALTCPSVNSYSRLGPNRWSSAYPIWGPDNREACVRVPSLFGASTAEHEVSTNLEVKAVDGSANPYLALGGLLAAGLDGVDRGLDPGEPLDVNPSDLGAEGLAARGLVQYPDSLLGVVRAFEDDHRLLDALGPTLAAVVLAVRRAEWEAFGALAPAEVALRHFARY
jgi:glutamine synthetase